MNLTRMLPLVAAILVAWTTAASAHFIWLLPTPANGQPTMLQVYFGEDASPDDPKLLQRLNGLKVWQCEEGKKPVELASKLTEEELTVAIPEGAKDALYITSRDLGVMTRGDLSFALQYYAKAGPIASHPAWSKISTAKELKLDIIPTIVDKKLQVKVTFDGKPAANAEIKTVGPGLETFTGATDNNGVCTIETTAGGICSLRAKHVEELAGEKDGQKFATTRHYCTLTVQVASNKDASDSLSKIEPLALPVTSFGAAITDGQLYVYGGHTGTAHSYSNKEQGRHVLSANIQGGRWATGGEGPPLQGLAMVTHKGKLYRIGGFTALNIAGEKEKLESQTDVAVYDPATKKWTELAPLPEPRSSHDAAVIGDAIYVVGGWALKPRDEAAEKAADETKPTTPQDQRGPGNRRSGGEMWHKTALKLDLTKSNPQWETLPEPPFQRRALSLAEHGGKLYCIGGMQKEGGVTPGTDIFDPATGKWSEGPKLIGSERMTGFGNSSFATGGKLYVTTMNGDLERLSDDGKEWKVIAKTPTARFFHRMLPIDDKHLLIVGGANMTEGIKFDAVEIIALP